MNKQELIKHFEEMEYVSIHQMGKKAFIDMIEQLDEPQKPVVPQFVGGWINYCKRTGVDLYHAFEMGDQYLGNYAYQKDDLKLKEFFETENNQDLFARAWLDGYTVEKEKRYLVKMSATKQPLFYNNMYEKIFFSLGDLATQFTRKQLEGLGLGWVFDCEGIEIEEVTE